MDKIGLATRIITATKNIDAGRKGFATRGKEQEGRILYEDGISEAMTVFQQAQTTTDPEIILLTEYTFITQELEFCEKTDKESISSLSKAIRTFDDAFLAIKAVEGLHYEIAEQVISHEEKYRIKGLPMDAYHVAIKGHRTRLQNILKSPGIDPIEKALLKQRFINLSAGQEGYLELQRKALK